ncbi:OLC1v1039010C1 [Oldenlandia corymbosa var. corymbosa]|uniref:OLC1v1039010C1 n=1 Tax=Oldenlandia corymbosa var. corymbosa TaxID=529605 RepID=A0AAV1D3C5_OLDCO|nr:OLC1v1039010C1 [Oldenlandia corymbosa var. corymbosa]
MSKFDAYDHLNVQLNHDGSLTRYVKLPTTPATEEKAEVMGQSAVSKDVVLNSGHKTWMRVYRPMKLPSNDKSVARLPIIIYFHGGGWIQLSVGQTVIHESLNKLSSEVPAIVVGVEYRLAPESRLPAQYEDAVEAVNWVKDQALDGNNGDKWLKDYGDFSRCYLYGISCGANIAFNAALRLSDTKLDPIKIAGVIMNQPFFGGKKRTKSELKLATDQYFPLPVIDLLWELALPKGADRDHRYCNPFVDGAYKEKIKSLGRSLVIGFGGDPLIERQQDLVQILVKQGVLVEARFDDVGFHGIEMIDTRRAAAIVNFIKEFV